jgi:hypothetical protein
MARKKSLTTCSEPGCTRQAVAKGMCSKHYYARRRKMLRGAVRMVPSSPNVAAAVPGGPQVQRMFEDVLRQTTPKNKESLNIPDLFMAVGELLGRGFKKGFTS